jgi:hypothetical protein
MASTKLARYNSSSNKSHHGDFTIDTGDHEGHPMSTPDILFENHGSLFLLRPVSPAGQTWLDENVGDGETQKWGGAIVCEPRYVLDVCRGAVDAGLVCR